MNKFQLERCSAKDLKYIFEKFHGYKTIGALATYAFCCRENDRIVAGFIWNPPAPGAALSIEPKCPAGVLSLSRMVAVPSKERQFKHISKPLKFQMKHLIDRTRWPVLVTYSDSSLGHNGYVYQCSGWQKEDTNIVSAYVDENGRRISKYCGGSMRSDKTDLKSVSGKITRWVHRTPIELFFQNWIRVPIPGKFWKSGNPAYRWEKST
jgi:hypothetical protein